MRNQKSRAQDCKVDHIDLIPGMPDDVAVDCLARVPHGSFRSMWRVCRGWRGAAVAPDFALARANAGANEDLVFLLQFGIPAASEDGTTQAYGVSVYNVRPRRRGRRPAKRKVRRRLAGRLKCRDVGVDM